jgi:hypothetical protein
MLNRESNEVEIGLIKGDKNTKRMSITDILFKIYI